MLGPFELIEQAGRGTTATVWRAVHGVTGTDVAIKVLTHPLWRIEQRGGRFEREVRALARLDHPALVRIHDYGWTDVPVAGAEAGCPYLVTDWHGGGTLDAVRGPLPFAALRSLLLRLLEGLGFAHARGLIHRDIKPGNVLMAEHGPVLTDMGLAWSLTDDVTVETGVCGTPSFMAPEQAAAEPWAFGPWTDIYAVGCLAWWAVTGTEPHRRDSLIGTLLAVAEGRLPPFDPRITVPDGFDAWLQTALAPDPRARFRFAADAARALLALPAVEDDAPEAPDDSLDEDGPAGRLDAPWSTVEDSVVLWASTLDASPDVAPLRPPRMMDWSTVRGAAGLGRASTDARVATGEWRSAEPQAPPLLPGCGRGLSRLRVPRLHGRAHDRQALWTQLLATVTESRARVAGVCGATGLGKTRLAMWLAHRAHALAVAEPIWIRPRAEGPHRSGLWSMLIPRGAAGPLATDHLQKHLQLVSGVDPGFAEVIMAFATGERAVAGLGETRTGLSEREGFVALLAALRARALERPQLMVLDDAHLDDVALRFVRYALERAADLPLLFLVAADRSAVDDPLVGRHLDALLERADGVTVDLHPLDAEVSRSIVRDRLRLDAATHTALVGAAAGNPLHADVVLQLWLDRGALRATPAGERLSALTHDTLPDGPVDAWSRRVEALVEELPPGAGTALEIAGVLGSPLSRRMWRMVCEAAGLPETDRLLAPLLDRDFLFAIDDGHLGLRHPLLGRALVARAARHGRLARLHGLCADALASGFGTEPARIARHLIAAGRQGDAMPRWFAAIEAISDRGDIVRWRGAILSAARTCRALRRPRTHLDRVRVKGAWAFFAFRAGEPAQAVRHGRQAVNLARAGGHVEQALTSLWFLARSLMRIGRPDDARAALDEADTMMGTVRDRRLTARHLRERCALITQLGDVNDAWLLSVQAAAAAILADDDHTLASVLNLQGELARRRGDLDAAERAYRDAIASSHSRVNAAFYTTNLALVQFERGAIDEAVEAAEAVGWQARRIDAPFIAAASDLVLLGCAGHRGDATAWDAAWAGLDPIRALRFVEVDLARTLDLAARAAADALPGRALAAAELAVRQYEKVGRAADADAIRRWIGSRSPSA